VLLMHITDTVLDEARQIDQRKFPLLSRLGGDWYAAVEQTSLFKLPPAY
jgi:hypothetical protein